MFFTTTSARKLGYGVLTLCFSVGIGWFFSNGRLAAAQMLQAIQAHYSNDLGSGFGYQGYLDQGGSPATGTYEFEFALYDALSGGNQVGGIQAETLNVMDGVFMVHLNSSNQSGTNLFDGSALFLETKVREVGASQYTTLTPRQALAAVPYAHYAQKVQPLANVITVAKSGGDYSTVNDALNAITDASADNPYLIHIAPGVFEESIELKSHVDLEGSGETNTIIRSTGGEIYPLTNGNGATLRASGNLIAEVRFLTVESNSTNHATAIWTNNVPYQSLKFSYVTAKAISTGEDSYAIVNYQASPSLNHVSATALGSATTGVGIYNYQSASPIIDNVVATATGRNHSFGIFNSENTSPQITNTTATAYGGNYAFGIYNSQASPTLTNVQIAANNAVYQNIGLTNGSSTANISNVTILAAGGEEAEGMSNQNSTVVLSNVAASGLNSSNFNYGIVSSNSDSILTNVQAEASGEGYNFAIRAISTGQPRNIVMSDITANASGGLVSYGLYNSESITLKNATITGESYGLYNSGLTGSQTVYIDHSVLKGNIFAIRNDTAFSVYVGASKLSHRVSETGVSCINSYDHNLQPLTPQCQCYGLYASAAMGCVVANFTTTVLGEQ